MAQPKTRPTDRDVADFIAAIPDDRRRAECEIVARLMRKVTRAKPRLWGPSIVGYGEYSMVYASGREVDWMLVGFSPRKQALTLYLMDGAESEPALLKKLGPYKTGKSCLYVKRLDDIDLDVLEEMIRRSVARVEKRASAASSKRAGTGASAKNARVSKATTRKTAAARKKSATGKASSKKTASGKTTSARKASTTKTARGTTKNAASKTTPKKASAKKAAPKKVASKKRQSKAATKPSGSTRRRTNKASVSAKKTVGKAATRKTTTGKTAGKATTTTRRGR